MNISEMRSAISEAEELIQRDIETIADLEAAVRDLGDVPAQITAWRLDQSRKRLPIDCPPIALHDAQRQYDSLKDTILAANDAVTEQRARVKELNTDLQTALEAAYADSWSAVCDEGRRIVAELEAARDAYNSAATKLFIIHQESGAREFFPGDIARSYAPTPRDGCIRPHDVGQHYDLTGYVQIIKPEIDKLRAWRHDLPENPEAPSPFIAS